MRKRLRYILLVGLIIIFVFTNSSGQNIKKVHLLFTGDIMCHGPQIESAAFTINEGYDFSSSFKWVTPVFKEVDLVIGNLETTFPGEPPYQGYPVFRGPDALAAALRQAGFDLLMTANNHTFDARAKGLTQTINKLQNLGLYQTGSFRNATEKELYYPLLVYKNGIKLAFLNYTYGVVGWTKRQRSIVNVIEKETIQKDIKQALLLKPDIVIAFMHWGKEYDQHEGEKQTKLANEMLKWGVDVIVGAHPHVVQPIKEVEVDLGNGAMKQGIVAYSLGNFISNQRREYTDGGILFGLNLEKDEKSGKTKVTDHYYLPIWRYIEKNKNNKLTFQVLPISVFEDNKSISLIKRKQDRAAMKRYAKHIRAHLGTFDSREKLLQKRE
ncbi:MAG: CapA family protein [Bacteroidetes bacterium]|nr:CapA family protein [Bacteroidota bacterium]